MVVVPENDVDWGSEGLVGLDEVGRFDLKQRFRDL